MVPAFLSALTPILAFSLVVWNVLQVITQLRKDFAKPMDPKAYLDVFAAISKTVADLRAAAPELTPLLADGLAIVTAVERIFVVAKTPTPPTPNA